MNSKMTTLMALNRKKEELKAQLTRQKSCMTDEKSQWKLELKNWKNFSAVWILYEQSSRKLYRKRKIMQT